MSLGMIASLMRRKKPTRKCGRCGLRYAFDSEACPHCSGLTDEEVAQLKKRLIRWQIGNARLGVRMFLAAAVIFVFILAITI